MERRPWLDRVADELARRGVPAGYRSRLLAELGDHIHDLTDEGLPMAEERLGEPAAVAAAAADRLRGGWVRRHPVLVFGLAPIPVAVGVMAAVVLGLGVFAWAADELTGWSTSPAVRPVAGRVVLNTLDLGVRFGAVALSAALFARLAGRAGSGRVWPAVAAVQLTALAAGLMTDIRYSDLPNQSSMNIGFHASTSLERAAELLTPGHVAQTLTPVLVGAALFARSRRSAGPVAAV
jgi:hypothetical protein